MERLATALTALAVALTLAACGGDDEGDVVAKPTGDLSQPATGTLKVFAWQDSLVPALMDPFKKQNPDLDIQTATFDSNAEAAAKISNGFKTDVVEICMDEAKPLITRGMLKRIDPDAITSWDDMAFKDEDGIRDENGKLQMVPLSAGPHGEIYNTEKIDRPIDSFKDLWDPEFKGQVAIEGDYQLPPIAVTALAMGIKDPMQMDSDQLQEVKDYMIDHRDQLRTYWQSEPELTSLYKSGEVIISDGNSAAAKAIREAGVPVKWVAPKEGTISWVCGFAISADAENIDAAYRLINFQASPEGQAIRGKQGYVMTNYKAMPLIPKADREIANPKFLETTIPEVWSPINDEWVRAFEEIKTGD